MQPPTDVPKRLIGNIAVLRGSGVTSVAEPDIDLTIRAACKVRYGADVVLDGDVDRQADGVDGRGYSIDSVQIGLRANNFRTFAPEPIRRGLTHSTARPRDDDDLVAQLHQKARPVAAVAGRRCLTDLMLMSQSLTWARRALTVACSRGMCANGSY